jgi:hypothetical protein
MLSSIHVENFRCFQRLDLDDLGRINVIVGDNASGKTAFLESLVLPSGNPDVTFHLRNARGIGIPMPILQRRKTAYDSLWKDLFFQLNQKAPITIVLRGTTENARSLRVFYNGASETPLFTSQGTSGVVPKPDASTIIPITFELTDAKGALHTLQPELAPTGNIVIKGPPADTPVVFFFAASLLADALWIASTFSDLSTRNEDTRLKETLKKIFPQITDLSVEVSPLGNASLYCVIPGMPEKIPIGLISYGINKLMAVLLGIASSPNGIALVDEIESGLYYKAFPKLWQAILQFSVEYNTQLFLTTHSSECLRALTPLLVTDHEKFRLLRSEKQSNGTCTIRIFKGKEFESALETGVEFR